MTAQLWVILGGNNARKGSTIRALTGAGKKRELDIALSGGEIVKILIAVMSVNEPAKAPDPASWAKQTNKRGGNHLLAFRTGSNRFENARAPEKYLKKFVEGGGVIRFLVNIGGKAPNWVQGLGCTYNEVTERDLPSNAIAHRIRRFWKWL